MINPDTKEVFMLSDYFGRMANSIGEYIAFNKGNMNAGERNRLYDSEIDLARLAGEINMMGVNLVFEDVKASLSQLEVITEGVKKAVKKALAVQDAINIATGLVKIEVKSGEANAILCGTKDL